MTAEMRRSLALAGIGLLGGFLLVLGLYGAGEWVKRAAAPQANAPEARAVAGAPTPGAPAERPGAATPEAAGAAAKSSADEPAAARAEAKPPGEARRAPAAQLAAAPAFDVIRVEPNGETVIAGRAAPNTTVEMLVDNRTVARALADPNGQFAIVPPALPAGNSEIALRQTGADGREVRSRESVAVVVAGTRDTKPLVALSAPDRPTVVLSQPDAVASAEPGTMPGGGPARPGTETAGLPPAGAQARRGDAVAPDARSVGGTAGPAQPVKIVSVDAQEGGRLYVTSQATPGATLRLYLNDTLVAPGSAGPDGKVTFTIGRGVRAGDYRVRIDQVDPVTGKVRHRSEVPFVFPASGPRVASREAPAAEAPSPAGPGAGMSGPTAAMSLPGGPAAATPAARQAEARAGAHRGSKAPVAARAAPPAAGPGPALAAAAPQAPTTREAARTVGPSPPAAIAPKPGEAPRDVFVAEVNTARITRGDSLWQISRKTYGKGDRYTVIYDANQGQIRDPDLIYPGQIFVLPTDDGTAAARQGGKRG
ncbi:LysM peptidoglycan-binding domain-containing protein [Methylobacterium nigriterrae]|uniref:LysM peptidoglycan-binding domain-containing protein n=1 Tax=Methylobacterium nigriterrae TaxID=3127512 RepID=UPI003013CC9D